MKIQQILKKKKLELPELIAPNIDFTETSGTAHGHPVKND
jgi:hypothetical protein